MTTKRACYCCFVYFFFAEIWRLCVPEGSCLLLGQLLGPVSPIVRSGWPMGLGFNSSPALHQMAARDFQGVIPEARLKQSALAQSQTFCLKARWNIFKIITKNKNSEIFYFIVERNLLITTF